MAASLYVIGYAIPSHLSEVIPESSFLALFTPIHSHTGHFPPKFHMSIAPAFYLCC